MSTRSLSAAWSSMGRQSAHRSAPLAAQLLAATREGDLLRLHLLLKNNTAEGLVNEQLDCHQRTALNEAVELGNEAVVVLLLAHKADRLQPNAEGKSAVELAFDLDAKNILELLTDAKAAEARWQRTLAVMQRQVKEKWSKERRWGFFGSVFAVATVLVWLIVFFAYYAAVWPRNAEKLIGTPAWQFLQLQLARVDEWIKVRQRYRPKLSFDDSTPKVVQNAVRQGEAARLLRERAREQEL